MRGGVEETNYQFWEKFIFNFKPFELCGFAIVDGFGVDKNFSLKKWKIRKIAFMVFVSCRRLAHLQCCKLGENSAQHGEKHLFDCRTIEFIELALTVVVVNFHVTRCFIIVSIESNKAKMWMESENTSQQNVHSLHDDINDCQRAEKNFLLIIVWTNRVENMFFIFITSRAIDVRRRREGFSGLIFTE